MKNNLLEPITAVILFASLEAPVRLAAQAHHHYKLIDMGTFGGPGSSFNETAAFVSATGDINHQGLAVGGAATSVPTTPTNSPLVCTLPTFGPTK